MHVKCSRNGQHHCAVGCEWGKLTRSALEGEKMQAIKAEFVRSLVVIGVIPSNQAAAKIAEPPTLGSS
jgi:hypothetical protein